jgi:hypothetical protein
MSWIMLFFIVVLYLLHGVVIQPWLTSLAHALCTKITGELTALNGGKPRI